MKRDCCSLLGLLVLAAFASNSGGDGPDSEHLFAARKPTASPVSCLLTDQRFPAISVVREARPPQQGTVISTRKDVIENLRAAVEYEVEQKNLPAFSISIVEGNEVVWADGFGFQDADKQFQRPPKRSTGLARFQNC